MEFLGFDLSKMAQSNLTPLSPDAILKHFPLEFLTKPIAPITCPPIIDNAYRCAETSWLADLRDVLMDVWRQPMTQLLGISVAVTGIVVCSWRLSQYWDDNHVKPMKPELKKRGHKVTWLQPSTSIIKVPMSSGDQSQRHGLMEQGIKESFEDDLEKGGSQKLEKVSWRIRDIVCDLKQLDIQRRALQAEIRLHQDACSKLKVLGGIERSKRQAAEDKIKMIELENVQLKRLNQIIAKKASLIDRLEFIINEKNAVERSDAMTSVAWVKNGSHMEGLEEEETVTCHLPPCDKLAVNSNLEQELKQTPSVSLSSEKGDKSSSVIVLSDDDHECSLGTTPRWQSPSPVTKTSSLRLQEIASTSSSLSNITGTARHGRRHIKRRSTSLHVFRQSAALSSPKKSADESSKYQDVKHEATRNMAPEKKESVGESVEEESFESGSSGRRLPINEGIVDCKDEQNGYNFHMSASPPKSHLRSETSQESSFATGSSDGVKESKYGDGFGNTTERCSRLPSADICGKMADIQRDGEVVGSQKIQALELNDAFGVMLSREVKLPINDLVAECVSTSNAKVSPKTPEPRQVITEPFSNPDDKKDFDTSVEDKSIEPFDEHGSQFPGIENVLKKNKQLPSEKQSWPKKYQFQAVRFINKATRDGVCHTNEEDNDLNEVKKGDDTWVVIMDHEQSTC